MRVQEGSFCDVLLPVLVLTLLPAGMLTLWIVGVFHEMKNAHVSFMTK